MKWDVNLRLSDGTISLRPFVTNDLDKLHEAIIESLDELSPWLPAYYPGYSLEETKDFLLMRKTRWETDTAYSFAVTDADNTSILGYCSLNEIDLNNHIANLGYWTRSGAAGKGIAAAATRLLAKWALDSAEFRRIELKVAVTNSRSLRVAEKSGAFHEGILRNRFFSKGKSVDVAVFSFIPDDI